jgi:ribosomal-protein-alanine N-acetyltransferase
LASPRTLFHVLDDGVVRGYAVFKLVAPEAQLVDLAMDPSALRRGLGRTLLEESFALLRREGFHRATLEVSRDNFPARRLYEGLGFAVVGRRQKFYNDGSDAILMDFSFR